MSSWLHRTDPTRPFLVSRGEVWTYGDAVAEIEARNRPAAVRLAPSLSPGSVFDVLAGVFGHGLMIGDVPGDSAGAALVVPTSGTSGAPRGVRLTLKNLEAAARGSAEHLGHGQDDTWLLSMPLNHVAGLSILLRQAWTGGSVLMLPAFDPEAVIEALGRGVTMASVVPTMLHRLLDAGVPRSHELRAMLVGGGPIPTGLLERAAQMGLPVLPTYGLTETFGQVATLRPGSPLAYKAHPLPGVGLKIEAGRVAVRGDQVFPGYAGEADREEEWFITGDLGELDAEGAVVIRGRADTVIITGGENVSPERIEAELMEHPNLFEAVVVGVPDPEWGQTLACLYAGEVAERDVSDFLKSRLPGFMVPKNWHRVTSIPKTGLGKPDRGAALAALSSESL